jgi:hypothetical protein
MADDPITIHSENWTGEIPKSPLRKPATTLQLSIGLFASVFIVVRAPLAVLDGFRTGWILVPLSKWHHKISANNSVEFATCIAGWTLAFLLMAILGGACVMLLLRKFRR